MTGSNNRLTGRTTAESMPTWARNFNIVNPVAYLMLINRMVMLKGSGIGDMAEVGIEEIHLPSR